MTLQRKMHYADENWTDSVCGIKNLPQNTMTWRLADVTCGACRRSSSFKQDLSDNFAMEKIQQIEIDSKNGGTN